jgi:hypothetical protein
LLETSEAVCLVVYGVVIVICVAVLWWAGGVC